MNKWMNVYRVYSFTWLIPYGIIQTCYLTINQKFRTFWHVNHYHQHHHHHHPHTDINYPIYNTVQKKKHPEEKETNIQQKRWRGYYGFRDQAGECYETAIASRGTTLKAYSDYWFSCDGSVIHNKTVSCFFSYSALSPLLLISPTIPFWYSIIISIIFLMSLSLRSHSFNCSNISMRSIQALWVVLMSQYPTAIVRKTLVWDHWTGSHLKKS